jgi:hypothetical protein
MARKPRRKAGPRSPLRRGAIPTPRHLLAATTPYSMAIGAPPTHIIIPKKDFDVG